MSGEQKPAEMPAWFEGEQEIAPPEFSAEELAKQEAERPPPIAVEGDDEDEEQAAIAEAAAARGEAEVDTLHYLKLPEPRTDRRPPSWARVPPAPFKFPKGCDVAFIRLKARWTAAQHKGDRVLIVWPNTDADDRLAYGRANGDGSRGVQELAKQMIRAVDGVPIDWSGRPGTGNPDQLWREIGPKGRTQMVRIYTQLHVLDMAGQADFFENCVELVSTG